MARPVHFAEVGEGNEGEVKIAFFLSKQCIGSTVHLIWTIPKGAISAISAISYFSRGSNVQMATGLLNASPGVSG